MDEDLWRTFKAGAILKGLTIAEGVEEALIQYFKLQTNTKALNTQPEALKVLKTEGS